MLMASMEGQKALEARQLTHAIHRLWLGRDLANICVSPPRATLSLPPPPPPDYGAAAPHANP